MGKRRITQARLHELLDYNPKTGVFVWKAVTTNRVKVGDIAGTISTQGYRVIGVDGYRWKAAVIAWVYMKGRMPSRIVDHNNCDVADDRLSNLRLATKSQNAANTGARRDNKLGIKGVIARDGGFRATIRGKSIGQFATADLAHAAYCREAKRQFGRFARGSHG